MHVSSLLEFCARQYAITEREGQQHLKAVTGGHKVMWKIGRAVEGHVRSSFIEAYNRQHIYGNWHCDCKRLQRVGFYRAEECTTCRSDAGHYKEVPLYDREANIVGNCDMPLMTGRQMTAVEIKSMNKEDFAKLTEPRPDHVFQGAGYRRLISLNDFSVRDHVVVLYVMKEFKWGSPYKEFHVDVTGVHMQRQLDRGWEAARSLKRAREGGAIPGRVCQSPANSLAKTCPVVGSCFNRKA